MSMTREDLAALIVSDLNAAGLTPAAIAKSICDAVFGPEVTDAPPLDPPRDETHASIDPATGALTAEAAAKAAQLKAAQDKLAEDQAKVASDEAQLEADRAAVADDEAALGGDSNPAGAVSDAEQASQSEDAG